MQCYVLGVARRGTWAMVTKIYNFQNVSSILPLLQKGLQRLSEHVGVIKTQTLKVCTPQSFF